MQAATWHGMVTIGQLDMLHGKVVATQTAPVQMPIEQSVLLGFGTETQPPELASHVDSTHSFWDVQVVLAHRSAPTHVPAMQLSAPV
jgi:hypothetical protein